MANKFYFLSIPYLSASFSHYIGIDWSGAKQPTKTFSIALARCDDHNNYPPIATTDKLSRSDVFDQISDMVNDKQRTLIGIDCNFGYCANVMHKQLGDSATAAHLWATVDSVNHKQPNFFAGEFWSSPQFSADFWQQGAQPHWFDLNQLRRITESYAAKQGFGIPESPFKLIGAKQVGKGGLAGMRVVHQLKQRFADKVAIWPFDAEHCNRANVVICEIYPRLFIRQAGWGNAKIRSIDDLNHILSHFGCDEYDVENLTNSNDTDNAVISDHLTDALIASAGLRAMVRQFPSLLDHTVLPEDAVMREGWIFGVRAE